MPRLIVKSGYTKDVQHFINNLEYSGNKIASQQIVFTNGERKTYNNSKKIDLDEIGRENINAIYLTFKDGKKITIGIDDYKKKTKLYQSVTVEQIIEKVPDNDTEEQLPRELQDLSFFRYMNYIGERPGAEKENGCGLFSLSGDIPASKAEELARSDDFKRGWMHIISMDAADAQRLGYDNRAAWRDLAISKAPEIARAYNISLENLRFYGGFHSNTDNPHVHINFYSTNPNEGYINDMEKASKKMKSLFTNAIFKDDVSEIKEAIGIAKGEMSHALAKVLAMKEVKLEYVDKLKEIANALPVNGKMHYQFAPPQTKELIKDFLRSLLQDETLAPLFQGYLKGYAQYAQIYADNPEVIDRQTQAASQSLIDATGKNAWRRLHNEIMQAAVTIRDINNEAPLGDADYFSFSAEQKQGDSVNKSGFQNSRWHMDITEGAAIKYAELKKMLFSTFSQSLLEDNSEGAQGLKALLNNENTRASSLLTAAIKVNNEISIGIGELAKELSGKPLNKNELIMSEPQLLQALLTDEKNSPVLSYSSWCKTAYVQMAASQVRKHCKRLSKVAGKHVMKTLRNEAAAVEPQLCQLYICNEQINLIAESNKKQSDETTALLKELNLQQKSLIASIYKATFTNDVVINKYAQKLEKQSKKHFDGDSLKQINGILKNDIVNGNSFAAPGTYISIFAQNLPDHYLKQLAANECKEATVELFKVISSTITEKIVNEPEFAEIMQREYQQHLEGNAINLESLSIQIFENGSNAAEQKQHWLTAMQQSIAKDVPTAMQTHVLERLSEADKASDRVLPFNNTIYHVAQSLPETITRAVLQDNPAYDEFKKTVNSTIIRAIKDGQRLRGDKTIPNLLMQMQTADEQTAAAIKVHLASIIKASPEVANAAYALQMDFEEQYTSLSSLDFSQADFEQEIFYEGFQSVSSTAEYYSDKFNELDAFFRAQRIQDAALHMIKGIAQGLFSEASSRETDLSNAESSLTANGNLTHKRASLSARRNSKGVDLNW